MGKDGWWNDGAMWRKRGTTRGMEADFSPFRASSRRSKAEKCQSSVASDERQGGVKDGGMPDGTYNNDICLIFGRCLGCQKTSTRWSLARMDRRALDANAGEGGKEK